MNVFSANKIIVMICLLCNGDGSIGVLGGGGGGQHYNPSVVRGGVKFQIQIGAGRVTKEMTDVPKNCPAPHHS